MNLGMQQNEVVITENKDSERVGIGRELNMVVYYLLLFSIYGEMMMIKEIKDSE